MSVTSGNNKRIAKNTFFLYCRQLITMAVSLYTVRVVLDVLGTEDYGIYNVVGGIVLLFSFLSTTMASATQRFLSFAMGNARQNLKEVFSISVFSYLILIGIILILAETLGLWFLNSKLTIPESRLLAANFIYQSSVLSFVITLLCIPYNASIIAMERMKIFAYASIIDAFLKLAIAWILPYIEIDRLKMYAILMLIAVGSVQFYYAWYCKRYFDFCRYKYCRNRVLLRDMLSFAGWNMFGAFANILRSQGANVLINIFFSPVVNAAYGIAYQINSAITNFTNNFYTAVRPQLVKLYASNRVDEMLNLGYVSSRFAFFLILVVSVPLFCKAEDILSIWLKEVPEFTILFLRIIIISSLIEVLAIPLANMLQAAGKIKRYQMIVSVIYLLNIPVSYIFLFNGFAPEITLWVNLTLICISLIPRLWICKSILGLSVTSYFCEVIQPICLSLIPIVLLVYNSLFNFYKISINIFFELFGLMIVSVSLIFALGLKKTERKSCIHYVTSILKNNKKA